MVDELRRRYGGGTILLAGKDVITSKIAWRGSDRLSFWKLSGQTDNMIVGDASRQLFIQFH
jgi:hypothetical protein